MYKAEKIDQHWCVIYESEDKKNRNIICQIPKYYIEDKGIANGIVKSLNSSSNKIILNLSI